MTSAADIPEHVIAAIEQIGVPYMLVGSYSSNHYAIPRSTNDVDFVVQLDTCSINDLADALKPRFRMDPQIRFETVLGTTRYIFNDVETGYRVEFFELSEDPHDQVRFERRCRVQFGDEQTWVPTAEDVIVMKLRWADQPNREKDRTDIKGVIAVQGEGVLDWDYIHQWCDQHDTADLLNRLRNEIPPEPPEPPEPPDLPLS